MDRIEIIYDGYEDIVEEFGKARIQERFQELYVEYNQFIEDKNLEEEVKLNTFTLMHAVLDYFSDISRLKSFIRLRRQIHSKSWRMKLVGFFEESHCRY